MQRATALSILVAIILAAAITAMVVIPIRVAFMDLREQNAALELQVRDFQLCTLHSVECEYEKKQSY